jgi:hypothetical protein
MKADHEIEVKIVGKGAEPTPPIGTIEMKVGETVRYFSPDGKVKIVFPFRSPFQNDDKTGTEVEGLEIITDKTGTKVHSSEILTLLQAERPTDPPNLPDFLCRCFITNDAGVVFGWSSATPNSGGDHHVR